ncbi:hypothetical protein ACIFOC_00440 [Leucobacter aridicollis]
MKGAVLATSNGAVQNNGQIQWVYSVSGVSQGSTSVVIKATAYFMSVAPYSQYFSGTKSWSGTWGSGSGAQAYNLPAGTRVAIVATSGTSVTLTDAQQTRSFTATAYHFFGSTTSTLTVKIPPRYARTPTGLTITRSSDTSHRLNWTRNSTYTSVVVQRQTNGGAWTQVGRPTGNAYTWTDTSTKAGNKYAYRVAGVGGSGQSAFSNVATVFTSPLAPTGVTATRSGTGIRVDASGKPAHATSYNIRDGATTVASGVSLPWTHANPNPAVPHEYTVQGVVSGLAGAWSAKSNTVQLISKPLPPTGLTPNGAVSVSDDLTRFSWKHNPVDSSEQTAAEYRRRLKDTTTWSTSTVGGEEQLTRLLEAGEYEWQIRTKGAHPDWSEWSAVAIFTVIDRPGVAVISPDELWTKRTVTAEWSWDQPQGRPQSAWEAILLGPDGEIERKTGTGATTKVQFAAKVADNIEYGVKVRAAAGDIWSEPAEQWFLVMVPPAAPADMSGAWSEDSGAVTLNVQDGRGGERAPVTNHFDNPNFVGDGTWVEIRRNARANSSFERGSTAYWGSNAGRPGVTLALETAEVHSGQYACKVTSEGLEISAGINSTNTYPMTCPNGVVTSSAWVKAPAGLRMRADLQERDTSNVYLNQKTLNFEGTGDWERIRITRDDIQPGNRVTFAVSIRFAEPGVFYVDDYLTEWSEELGGWFGDEIVGSDIERGEDFRVRFDGTDSVLEGERARGFITGSGAAFISSSVDGVPAGRLINVSGAASSAYAGFALPDALIASGGVFQAIKYQESEIARAAGGYGIRASSVIYQTPFDNVAGHSPHRVEFPPGVSIKYVYFGSQGYPGGGDVYWTAPGLFGPGYVGPAFSGSSGLVKVGDTWMSAAWDGAVDNSTSTIHTAPPAVRVDVERSVNGGLSWETFIEGGDLPVVETDPQALSNGTTLYRVTTYSADDAASVVVHEVEANSPAVWLSGGPGFTDTARLPYDPEVDFSTSRERILKQYAGREKPVVYSGEAVTRTVQWSGTLLSHDSEVASVETLERISQAPAPLHLYRDPDGRHVKGMLAPLSKQRVADGMWSYSTSIEEADD